MGEEKLANEPENEADAGKLRRRRLLRISLENLGHLQSKADGPPRSRPTISAPSNQHDLKALIEKRFEQLQGPRDHFAVLGIPRSAGREQVKAAFLNFAKIFHPDRLPPELSNLSPKTTDLFEAIRVAHDALLDDVKREAYRKSLERPTVAESSSKAKSASELYRKGEACLKKRDFRGAEALFSEAHALEPSAWHLAARAWAIYADPERKEEMPQAKQMMLDALKLNNQCDRAHYQLGVVCRVHGELEKAQRHFHEAVRANPKHVEARQEIRLMELRRRNGAPPSGT